VSSIAGQLEIICVLLRTHKW